MERELFQKIVNKVKVRENYVPRNYQTMGGMWTVETYQLNDVKVQVMDEGYTIRLVAPNVIAVDYLNKFELDKGTEKDLEKVLASL